MTDPNDMQGALIIVPENKYPSKGKNRPYRRTYHPDTQAELESLINLAQKYANENNQGFLIVKVIQIIPKPNGEESAE